MKLCHLLSLVIFLFASERLVREREILEERADRRLEIYKNLINNMSVAESKRDAETMVTYFIPLGSFCSRSVDLTCITENKRMCFFLCQNKCLVSHAPELVDLQNLTDPAGMCSVSVQAAQQAQQSDAVEKPETNVLALTAQQQQDTQTGKTTQRPQEENNILVKLCSVLETGIVDLTSETN